jgi:hypothetical protein
LVTYFTKTEAGAKSLKVIMGALGAVVGQLTNALSKAGEFIFKMFSSFENFKESIKSIGASIKENLINRFQAFGVLAGAIGKILKGDFKQGLKELADGAIQLGTGIENATDKMAKFASGVAAAAKAGADLAKRQNDLNTATREAALVNSKLAAEIFKQQEIAKDQNRTLAERIKALDKQAELEKQILDNDIERAQAQYEILKAKNQLEAKTEETIQAETDAAVKVQELENQKLAKYVQVNAERSGLIKQAQTEELTAMAELEKVKEEANAKAIEDAKAEVERKRSVNDELRALQQEAFMNSFTDQDDQRKIQLDYDQANYEEDLQRQLENAQITADEMQALRDANDIVYKQKRKELEDAIKKDEKEAAKAKIELAKKEKEAKVGMAMDGASTLIALSTSAFGENKVAAIASTTIETYKAATSAYASLAAIPVVGPALGIVAAGLAIVAGLKNVQKITSTSKPSSSLSTSAKSSGNANPSFGLGGYVGGYPHSLGGTPINAELGEFVVNKATMASPYGSMIVAANAAGVQGKSGGQSDDAHIISLINQYDMQREIVVVESKVTEKQKEVQIRESSYKR